MLDNLDISCLCSMYYVLLTLLRHKLPCKVCVNDVTVTAAQKNNQKLKSLIRS